ncbi:MAG: hypothetical protein JST80_05780 [Bdellovibrionales bacterium]|nr:hypothetical protein [Bdellovibrionales bacterium]
MKSKSAILVGVAALIAAGFFAWQLTLSPFQRALSTEWVENSFPENVDTEDSNWNVLPYGYTLAPWPKTFQGEPIVTKLTYHKGPPKKFLQEIVQIWRPVEVELRVDGPRTLVPNFKASDWKRCFASRFNCRAEKAEFQKYLGVHGREEPQVTWFETLDVLGARGVHTLQEFPSYDLNRYTVITDKGVLQTFMLKSVRNPVGTAAIETFLKVLGGMKVRDDLEGSKEWIQSKIKAVRLDVVRATPDPKLRIEKMIQVQNYIASHLSVDPTQFPPYFHLAGVTHMLGVELFRAQKSYFGNQEAWTLNIKPMLETLIQYARDFQAEHVADKNAPIQVQNLEALLQEILLLQQKLSKGQNLKR